MIFKLLVQFVLFELSSVLSCPTISSHNCICDKIENPTSRSTWNLACFSNNQTAIELSVVIDFMPNQELKVECVSEKLTPDLFVNITGISKFQFLYCQPDYSIYDLLNQRSVTKLKYQSSRNLDLHLFDNLLDLKILDISRNRQSNISKDLFVKMTSLQILNIAMNDLEILDEGIFDNLRNLSHLFLSSNHLATISEDVFLELNHLQVLSLSKNKISDIPEGIFHNVTSLKVLDLSRNKIEKLPKYLISTLSNLLRFEIRHNLIQEIPFYFFNNNQKLEILDVSGNKLNFLASNVLRSLKNLEIFRASNNQIKTLPADVFSHNANLREIKLKKNFIHKPNTLLFSNNSLLKTLDLSENHLGYLESKFLYKQYNLEWLSLASCNLLHIAEDLFRFASKLKYLDLSDNKLDEFSIKAFEHLPNLEHLKLRKNHIRFLNTSRPFGVSASLKSVDLSHNYLTQISNIEWIYYPDLKSLNVQYNKLAKFSIPVMYSSEAKVFLQNNIINTISIKELKFAKELEKELKKTSEIKLVAPLFYVFPNPLTCDCDMFEFYKMLKHGFTVDDMPSALFPVASNLQCFNPPELRGKKLVTLQEEEFRCAVVTNCPHTCYCYRRGGDGKVIVNCTSTQMTKLPEILPKAATIIHLENNQISNLDFKNSIWMNCTELYLANNTIQSVDVKFPPKIRKLSLNNNLLTYLPFSFIHWIERNKDILVSLSGNPYRCNCSIDIRFDLLHNFKKIMDLESIYCTDPENTPCFMTRNICFKVQLILFIFAVIILSTFILFTFIQYRKRRTK
ncbi:protein toll-like isoform X2 [Centruroides vittatus]